MARTASAIVIVSLTTLPLITHAQLAITEIMYDLSGGDTGREWIEVQNVGTDSISLTEWKLFEANSNHGLTAEASDTLVPNQFAIIADDIAKFRADWPSFSGLVVNSSFSLNNSGESLSLRCCGKDISDRDTVAYTADLGALGDGNSLHRNGSSWSIGAPSPGNGSILAPIVAVEDSKDSPAESDASAESTPPVKKSTTGAISVDAGGNRTALAKSSLVLGAKALTSKKEPIEHADFSWNFGDGRAGSGKSISHAWGYPGKYQVTLRVSYEGETASDSFVVEVIEPDFEVTRFDDGSVGILNGTSRDTDVSRWRVHDGGKNFVLPEGTIILKGALLRIAPETLGFMTSQASVHYPDGALYERAQAHQDETEGRVVSQVVVPVQVRSAPDSTDKQEEVVESSKKTVARLKAEEPEEERPNPVPQEETENVALSNANVAAVSASGALLAARWYWWLGALCISLVGAVGMLALQKPKDDWIIEDGDTVE